jgi:hypothetical protein
MAQQASGDGSEWTPFENVSNSPAASTYPCITADSAGNVHVLWSEDVGGKSRNLQFNTDGSPALDVRGRQVNYLTDTGNTLFYRRWNGQKWMDPVDVQVNSNGRLQYPKAVVDALGVLHVIWVAAEGFQASLMYSHVWAAHAERVNEWSTPVVLADAVLFALYPVDMVVDQQGGLHILYSETGGASGAYVTNSLDAGKTWSSPVAIYRTGDAGSNQEGVSPARLLIDSKGRLHATWTRYGADGNGKEIFYAQSTDAGRTWSKPAQIALWQPGWYEVDWLSVGVVGDEIHLVWEGSASVAALNERISTDAGKTWSEGRQILTNLVGENGFAVQATDSADQLHLFVVQRGDAGALSNGVWSTVWDKDRWRDPLLLSVNNANLYGQLNQLSPAALQGMVQNTFTGNGVRYPQVTRVNGNELFLVAVNEWDGDIYSSHVTLSTPRIAPQPYTLPASLATATPAPTSPAQATPTPTQVVTINRALGNPDANAGDPILYGSLPVIALLAVIALYVGIIKRNNA